MVLPVLLLVFRFLFFCLFFVHSLFYSTFAVFYVGRVATRRLLCFALFCFVLLCFALFFLPYCLCS